MQFRVTHVGGMGTLELFPGIVCPGPAGTCRVHVAGQLRRPYQPTVRKRMLIRLLAKVMRANDEDVDNPLFRSRVEPFVSDGWGGVDLVCVIGEQTRRLTRPTRGNGHFSEWLTVDRTAVEAATEERGNRQWVRFAMRGTPASHLASEGWAIALPTHGVSVVSDVDDTIKETEINERRQLLANTFLREFREIEGMAALYRQWAEQGIDFHYVSSSPWQLFLPLWQMLQACEFPLGSIHLRAFRLRNHMLQRMVRIRRSGKARAIRELMQALPEREFVLVGDSGEKDLEIYGKLASRHPGRIRGIMIRDLPAQSLGSRRLERCRRRLAGVPCMTFSDTAELGMHARSVLGDRQHGAP